MTRPGGRTDDEQHWPLTEEKRMGDLVKRARKGRSANEFPSEELVHEMADEIERLRKGYLKPRSDVGWITKNVLDDV